MPGRRPPRRRPLSLRSELTYFKIQITFEMNISRHFESNWMIPNLKFIFQNFKIRRPLHIMHYFNCNQVFGVLWHISKLYIRSCTFQIFKISSYLKYLNISNILHIESKLRQQFAHSFCPCFFTFMRIMAFWFVVSVVASLGAGTGAVAIDIRAEEEIREVRQIERFSYLAIYYLLRSNVRYM